MVECREAERKRMGGRLRDRKKKATPDARDVSLVLITWIDGWANRKRARWREKIREMDAKNVCVLFLT